VIDIPCKIRARSRKFKLFHEIGEYSIIAIRGRPQACGSESPGRNNKRGDVRA